jgi:hypothetical protein
MILSNCEREVSCATAASSVIWVKSKYRQKEETPGHLVAGLIPGRQVLYSKEMWQSCSRRRESTPTRPGVHYPERSSTSGRLGSRIRCFRASSALEYTHVRPAHASCERPQDVHTSRVCSSEGKACCSPCWPSAEMAHRGTSGLRSLCAMSSAREV